MSIKIFLIVFIFIVKSCFTESLMAVVNLTSGSHGVTGQVVFKKINNNLTSVTGYFKGLEEGIHGVHIHDKGDLSDNCAKVGPHFDPHNEPHGVHVGDVANIHANSAGEAVINIVKNNIRLDGMDSVIGRSLGIDEGEDSHVSLYSLFHHHEDGEVIACGIIEKKISN